MADRLRVPFAKPPARHRMPTPMQLRSLEDDSPDRAGTSLGSVARRMLASANLLAACATGAVLVQMLTNPNSQVGGPGQVLTEQERHALAAKRYAACTVTHITTGMPGEQGQRFRVDWRLDPDVAVNQLMQTRLDDPGITFGPSTPVVRMFNLDAAGQPVISTEIGQESIDVGGRRNPDSFYAALPIPLGAVRYALSVRTSVVERTPGGNQTVAYGEQQCAELIWQRAAGTKPAHWESAPPDPALAKLDRYAVHTLPATHKTGGV